MDHPDVATIDKELQRISSRTAGAFTSAQARAAGIPDAAVRRRVRRGGIVRLHAATFFGGHVITTQARRWAAVLAAGADALLGGEAAEDEWGLARRPRAAVEIVVTRRQHRLDGVKVLQTRTLHDEDRTLLHGRPTTTVERTLVDVAGRRTVGELGRALREAAFRGRLDVARLRRTIERNRTRAGIGRLRRALDLHEFGHGGTDSGYEDRFARMLDRAGIPGVATNVVLEIGGTELRVDVFIEHLDLVVEIDPDWHDEASIRREDALRAGLCRRDGRRHLTVRGTKLRDGVAVVAELHRTWLELQRR